MNESVELAKLLHDSPDLFPWVCLAVIILIIISQHKRILAYFDARIDAYTAKKQSDAVMAELVRNNTAALNNNTAALESVKGDRGETRRLLQYHEDMSKERHDILRCDLAHIQNVVNRSDSTLSSNSKILGLLEDRTDGER